jgi:hypothetical protein
VYSNNHSGVHFLKVTNGKAMGDTMTAYSYTCLSITHTQWFKVSPKERRTLPAYRFLTVVVED